MLDINQRKSRFSLAYIEAIASCAGYQVCEPVVDHDSVDGILMGDEGRRPRVEFQAKATSQDVISDQHLNFFLKMKNYDDLRAEVIIPRILIVVAMPTDEADWSVQSESELNLRRCAYWHSLAGASSVSNQTGVTVSIARANVFSAVALRALMSRAEQGTPL